MEKKKQQYVLGFLFNEAKNSVILIRKNKPKWQNGLLNGVGGKVESGELIFDAMVREFKEEAGVRVLGWNAFCELHGDDFEVVCFAVNDNQAFGKCRSTTFEIIERHDIRYLHLEKCVGNTLWLIHMALNFMDTKKVYSKKFYAVVRYNP